MNELQINAEDMVRFRVQEIINDFISIFGVNPSQQDIDNFTALIRTEIEQFIKSARENPKGSSPPYSTKYSKENGPAGGGSYKKKKRTKKPKKSKTNKKPKKSKK